MLGGSQGRLQLGMFTVSPAIGSVPPNNAQTVTVDCVADLVGKCDEELVIDISERNPYEHKGGVYYRLFAESCAPSINQGDIGTIFEEHRICANLNRYQVDHEVDPAPMFYEKIAFGDEEFETGGIYGEEENRFVFSNVIVGTKARARFRISNSQKVPCDVSFTVKQMHSRATARVGDVFDVEPSRAQIPPHGSVYATVTFAPPSMQTFVAHFEANVEGQAASQSKARTIAFEVGGEGNLPRVSIVKPALRNKRGQPLCQFRKLLVGRKDSSVLHLVNDGTLPSRVDIDLIDPDGVFSLKPFNGTEAIMNEGQAMRYPHTASLLVNVGSSAQFLIFFAPDTARRSQAQLKVAVISNQYEDSIVQLVGEGYEDDVTFENMPYIDPVLLENDKEDAPGSEEPLEAAKHNLLFFGDCHLGQPKTQSFSLANHSATDTVRFAWPSDHAQVKFSPAVGHLHPGQSRSIVVTFKADAPVTLKEKPILVKLTKINLGLPEGEKPVDWDDTKRTMKWVDIPEARENSGGPRKRKVVETEPEPAFTEEPDGSRSLDMLVTGLADFCKFKCKPESIKFKDTLVFQTRQFDFNLSNKGSVALDFSWRVMLESGGEEGPPLPFEVCPVSGSVAAGQKTKITVKFSPLAVVDLEARLVCHIGNLEEGKQGPTIALKAKSLLPFCHFELEDSDYLSGARRNPALRGPGAAPAGTTLDPNTRVIELNTIGVGGVVSKVFNIVNPTTKAYDFEWQNLDSGDVKEPSAFRCVVQGGRVLPGKKAEQRFDFCPTRLGITESFWRFVIPDHNISVPFLVMGESREPNLAFDRSHFNFRALLLGHEAREVVYLVNPEENDFSFGFLESSRHAPGYSSSLQVSPSSGVVPARSKIPIELCFCPINENEVNFTLVCNIKRKTLPITLNVKAEGYSMRSELWGEEDSGHKHEYSGNTVHDVSLGEVEINEETSKVFYVLNNGKFDFDFAWEIDCPREEVLKTLQIENAKGSVKHGEKTRCQLIYKPTNRALLRGVTLRCVISNGPTYVLNICGSAVPVGITFSSTRLDFGPRFVYRPGMAPATQQLIVTNNDRKAISVDCHYASTSQLTHDFTARVIPPGEAVIITLTFYPREATRYREVLEFEVNGMSRHCVEVLGQGTELRVEVREPKQKLVSLGVAQVGAVVRRTVPIVNNSLAAVTFRLAVTPSCPALVHDPDVLKVLPANKELTLAGKGGSTTVEVVFSPQARIPKFTEEVFIEAASVCLPLLAVSGCCHGFDIHFDMDAVAFGAVVKGSRLTKHLLLSNTGDIGAKFRWDPRQFAPDFSITPLQGYISPGMEVPFDITFAPQKIASDVRYDNIMCYLEGTDPLPLILTGMCIQVTPVKETQHFSTYVRQKDMKPLQIINRTNASWLLKPVIEGEHWSGPETLVVEPQQTRPYELTYRPLTMTLDGKRHQGSVFFALPDGSGLLYNVTGTSDPPKANAKLTRDVPCKTAYTEVLPVHNWLRKPQRFKVTRELVKPDKLDPGTVVKGLDYVDVPGNGKRDYKLSFFANREGQSQMKIVFTTEGPSSEYQFYEILFRAGRPASIRTIQLSSPVRQAVPHTVALDNPLNNPVTFAITSTLSELHFPTSLQIPAQSTGSVNIEFCPLKVGDYQGKLEFSSTELGLYTYDLDLRGTPAGPERALYFRTHLGGHQGVTAKFMNHAKQKTDYACKVDNPDFHCDKTVAAAPGVEVSFEVTYQPSRLGDVRASLLVTSASGGDFVFPLHGSCLAPKPQGPINVKSGGTTSITFRNVFPSPTPYSFQVDNTAFHLTKTGDTIRPNKDYRIVVGFDGQGVSGPVMGKLIVSCARSAGNPSNLQWVFYLRGTP